MGLIIPTEQSLTSMNDLNIVSFQMHPFMTTIFAEIDDIYKQDNAQCYRVRIFLEYLKDFSYDFQDMSWPSNLSDMNSIEHLWFYLNIRTRVTTLPLRLRWELQSQLVRVSIRYQKLLINVVSNQCYVVRYPFLGRNVVLHHLKRVHNVIALLCINVCV